MEVEKFIDEIRKKEYFYSVYDTPGGVDVGFRVIIHGRVMVTCDMIVDRPTIIDSNGRIIHSFMYDVYARISASLWDFRNHWCRKKMQRTISTIISDVCELQKSEKELAAIQGGILL